MIECAGCRATNAPGVAACAKCGAPLAGLRGGGKADELAEEAARRELDGRQRIRRLRRIHAAVGAMTFFLLHLLWGLPESLHPRNLIVNALLSTAVGMPVGYLISLRRAGMVQGALLSMAAFMILGLVLALLSGRPLAGALAWGLAGILPGALIGFHVSIDE